MPFIGKQPEVGAYQLIDSITTSATATFALAVGGTAYFPASARNLLVSLNGITQAPDSAYTVSGSNIVFDSALTSSDVIDYILVMGDALDIGTPSDGTVGTAKMSYPLGNFSSTGIDDNADATAITIDSSEQVGIGISDPLYKLQVAGATSDADGALGSQSPLFSIQGGNANNQLEFGMDNSGATAIGFIQSRNLSAGAQTIALNPAGGSVVVGKTTLDNSNVGCRLNNTGDASFVAHENRPLVLVRKSTSGDHIIFIKDSTTVGAIGDKDADSIYINQGDAGLRFVDGVNTVMPCKENGVVRDNAIDLGTSGNRFNTVYAGTGSINTSDERAKQDIEELTEVETRVAVAAKSLLRKYRWKDMVQAKDDNTRSDETARIHFGIIAQDLKAAFEAEGLDAGRYGMFIHTTWTDEETGEECDRMGIRYSELLAFIIAAI
tara:strand:- start:253 stop:1563 length:1311 start_codon:yes stop_codon:yes gene_type:complete